MVDDLLKAEPEEDEEAGEEEKAHVSTFPLCFCPVAEHGLQAPATVLDGKVSELVIGDVLLEAGRQIVGVCPLAGAKPGIKPILETAICRHCATGAANGDCCDLGWRLLVLHVFAPLSASR
jgi:hypothetical protein